MIRIIMLLCTFGLPAYLWAQVQTPDVCGTVMDDQAYAQYGRAVQNEQSVNFRSTQTITLKLQPHIVRRSNGTGGLSLIDLNTSIQQLNAAFAPVGFYFEYCTPNYIDNDAYFNQILYNQGSGGLEYQMAFANRIADAVNVFFCPNAVFNSSNFPINWSNFPFQEQVDGANWTIMNNFYATDGETLAHEIGHYFNLLHTHHTGMFDGQNILAERVTRNPNDNCFNCNTAGDFLCDTEAEPVLANRVNANCQFIPNNNSTDRDNCGVLYQPNTRNVMSYAYVAYDIPGCRTDFTQGQINRMWAALTQYRTNLANSCSGCPTTLNVTQNVLNGQVDVKVASNVITASNIVFSGGIADYNAGNEVVLTPGFEARMGANFDGVINGCNNPAATPRMAQPDNSTTTDATIKTTTEETISMTIAPNPATDQFQLSFSLASNRAFINIMLLNAQGQVVQETLRQENLFEGEYNVAVNTSDLPAGIYFVRLLTEKENTSKRVVIFKN